MFLFKIVYTLEREGGRKRKLQSFSKSPQQLWLVQAKPRSQEPHLGLPHSFVRGLGTRAVLHWSWIVRVANRVWITTQMWDAGIIDRSLICGAAMATPVMMSSRNLISSDKTRLLIELEVPGG